MPIQHSYTDRFKRDNPAAYTVVTAGSWQRGSNGFQITFATYASKAAFDAGGEAVSQASVFVPYDSSTMTSGIEQFIMQLPEIAAGAPAQVA